MERETLKSYTVGLSRVPVYRVIKQTSGIGAWGNLTSLVNGLHNDGHYAVLKETTLAKKRQTPILLVGAVCNSILSSHIVPCENCLSGGKPADVLFLVTARFDWIASDAE